MRSITKVFKALSDANRLRILKMLEVKPMAVCEITSILQLATSTVSKHLAILRDAGFIIDQKDGKWVNYQLNKANTTEYIAELHPLVVKWLDDFPNIRNDHEKALLVDRRVICGI